MAEINVKHHKKGTIVAIEGPRFSSHVESSVINITTILPITISSSISVSLTHCIRYHCQVILEAVADINVKHHNKGSIVAIKGPRFSSRVESSVINITTILPIIISSSISVLFTHCIRYHCHARILGGAFGARAPRG